MFYFQKKLKNWLAEYHVLLRSAKTGDWNGGKGGKDKYRIWKIYIFKPIHKPLKRILIHYTFIKVFDSIFQWNPKFFFFPSEFKSLNTFLNSDLVQNPSLNNFFFTPRIHHCSRYSRGTHLSPYLFFSISKNKIFPRNKFPSARNISDSFIKGWFFPFSIFGFFFSFQG